MGTAAAVRRGALATVDGVLELLAPTRCLACRRRAHPIELGAWCRACDPDVVGLGPHRCARCAGPRTVGHGCWPPGASIESTIAVDDYRGPVAAAVVAAKLGGAHAAWPALARRLATRVAADPPPVDVVTAVATGPDRVRRRGVDHAAVLAAAVAAAVDAPCVRLLAEVRRGGGTAQRATRSLPGTAVLLVDDVLTTGRTASGAGAALLGAGAEAVHLAVLARAGDHPLVDARAGRRTPRRSEDLPASGVRS